MRNIAYLTLMLAAIVCGCKSQSSETKPSVIEGVFLNGDSSHIELVANGDSHYTISLGDSISCRERLVSGDSIAVKYNYAGDSLLVRDVILLSRPSRMSNVALMFVGTWLHPDRAVNVTFNLDYTAIVKGSDISAHWNISDRKLAVSQDNSPEGVHEYDIIRIDDNTLTLCYADSTIHLVRARN